METSHSAPHGVYHISAVDDTKVHRNSPDVWGTCTFHEYTARCPNRAPTVRAHNWGALGATHTLGALGATHTLNSTPNSWGDKQLESVVVIPTRG